MTARGLFVAAPRSGSGKTTVTLGLLAALERRGLAVRAAKAGPDYIDAAFHTAATGAASVNCRRRCSTRSRARRRTRRTFSSSKA
jgi:cobyrinic acid a,c-diamide synthase